MSLETSEGLLEAIGTQALTEGTYYTPEAITQKIDAVSSSDVVNVSQSSEQTLIKLQCGTKYFIPVFLAWFYFT